MSRFYKHIFFALFAVVGHYKPMMGTMVSYKVTQAEHAQHIQIYIGLEKDELLYKDSIHCSVDSPYLELSVLHYDKSPLEQYDDVTKETKTVFEQSVDISFDITKKSNTIRKSALNGVFLYLTYQTNQHEYPQQQLFPLQFDATRHAVSDKAEQQTKFSTPSKQNNTMALSSSAKNGQAWPEKLSILVQQTQSLPIRLLLVFLLGILLSLTPCIYPMIPITIGILQRHKSTSYVYNFLHAICYTLGLSTTFAAFGLVASCTGPIYGKLLTSPFSVAILVLFLGYLGLSMFGLYDVQLPQWLRFKRHTTQEGSLVSSFFFGTASGTIASPCISPGLILLLSIVASLGNLFLGFLLLFAFGVGLSTPLLVIGTFSSSLTLLPRAGAWMIEVKKLFGLMLFGLCFYYLSNVVSYSALMYMLAAFLLTSGFYFLQSSRQSSSQHMQNYKGLMSSILIIAAIITLGLNLKHQFLAAQPRTTNKNQLTWFTDYSKARQKAQNENKLLLLDFWAEYCSVCVAINRYVLNDQQIAQTLQNFILISINGTDETSEPYCSLKKRFNVLGFPTLLAVNPNDEQVLKQWHSELYQTPKEQFISELGQLG